MYLCHLTLDRLESIFFVVILLAHVRLVMLTVTVD